MPGWALFWFTLIHLLGYLGLAKLEEEMGVDLDGDGIIGSITNAGNINFGGAAGSGGGAAGGVPNELAGKSELHQARVTIAGMGAPGPTGKSPKGKKPAKQKSAAQKEIEVAKAAKEKIEEDKKRMVFRKSTQEHDAVLELNPEQLAKLEFEMEKNAVRDYDVDAAKEKAEGDARKVQRSDASRDKQQTSPGPGQ